MGDLVHDENERLTMSHEMDSRVREHTKILAQMVRAMKVHREEVRAQLTLEQHLNQTGSRLNELATKTSYLRELEMLLMKIYADVMNVALSLDLAMSHRLTASLLPSHKLYAILRDIYVQL